MTQIFIQDRSSFKVTSREVTDEGFLRVPGRVARTGIQQYLRKELQLDGDPNAVVNVYRSPDEVFKAESLDSYNCADITIRHPGDLVNSKTYSSSSKGVVRGSGRQDGDFVVADLIIKDHEAIEAINNGMAELSAGYTAEYIAMDGTTESGDNYQYIQRDIKINHIALIERARAGRQARIFDNQPRDTTMTHKAKIGEGRSIEVQDEATALLVTDSFDGLTKAAKDAQAEVQQKQAVIDAQAEEITALKLKTTDESIKDRVNAIAKVKDSAIKIAGDAFVTESMDSLEIMRSAMEVARPNAVWADKSAPYVQAAFDMALESALASPESRNKEQLASIAKDGALGVVAAMTDAHTDYKNSFINQKGAK